MMATRDDIYNYLNVMKMYDALDECDMVLGNSSVLSEILGDGQREKFKTTWNNTYKELAKTLEYARTFAMKKCLEGEE